jgi:hypothetical protein
METEGKLRNVNRSIEGEKKFIKPILFFNLRFKQQNYYNLIKLTPFIIKLVYIYNKIYYLFK